MEKSISTWITKTKTKAAAAAAAAVTKKLLCASQHKLMSVRVAKDINIAEKVENECKLPATKLCLLPFYFFVLVYYYAFLPLLHKNKATWWLTFKAARDEEQRRLS